MLIGEIVAKTGLTKDTIRFYEKKGLIKVKRSDSEWNNYKNYDPKSLRQLLMIKKAKGFGFTLDEIAELFDLLEMDKASCDILSIKIKDKLDSIDQKIKALKEMKKMILNKISTAQNICVTAVEDGNCKSLSDD